MIKDVNQILPAEVLKILLVLSLSFIIGLEREEKKTESEQYHFGGVRAFPLIGLLGYAVAILSEDSILPMAIGLTAIGGLFVVSYWHKITSIKNAGITSEISGLITYVLGALVFREHYWVATTLVVICLFLLELKNALESLTKWISAEEVISFTKFLLLTAVILPVVPNQEFTAFQLNPFKIWLVVVAVSTVSYASYVLQRLTKGRRSIFLSALLGGAYSSTVTTVVLAKQSRKQNRPHLFAGSILLASGVMYLRLILLLSVFNWELSKTLFIPFVLLAFAGFTAGWLLSRSPDQPGPQNQGEKDVKNPLELKSAFLFAGIFLFIIVITHLTLAYLGTGGVYGLAALMGLSDVDPFILSLTQTVGSSILLIPAAVSILIAASSNNLIKGIYAMIFADRKTGLWSLIALTLLALAGLIPLFWL